MQGHCSADSRVFVSVKGAACQKYQAALNHVFSLAGLDLEANKVINRMFSCFEKTCLPRDV